MTRTLAVNFTVAGTQFELTDAATDPYHRAELQVLAKAVDAHDHGSGRGLAPTRVAAGIIDAAALANGAVTNPKLGGLAVATANIQDAAIATAKLAAGAVSQRLYGFGSASTTTTSATLVDLDVTNNKFTFTTGGGDLLCWWFGNARNTSAGGGLTFAFDLDSIGGLERNGCDAGQANVTYAISMANLYSGVSAGSHTVKVMWRRGAAGTAECFSRGLLILELKR